MPQTFLLNPGNWIIEDDGIPGNNRSRIRNRDSGTFQDFTHAADSITFLASADGVNLTVAFTDGLGAASFTVGSLTDSSVTPDSIIIQSVETTARVTLVANGSIVEGDDSDFDADIVARQLVLSAGTGIGISANAIETQVAALEAQTGTGGVNLANSGRLTIADLVAEVPGIRIGSGDLVLRNLGTIEVSS